MIDLIYLAHNRKAFTEASLVALRDNTDFDRVGRLHLYDDNSTDGAREVIEALASTFPIKPVLHFGVFGHPVTVMQDFLRGHHNHSIFAKIDSDTMVPPGWLSACIGVMEWNPGLDFLGIEAFNRVDVDRDASRGYTDARFIGGIGLMRRRAFTSLPEPNGPRFGFTEWQERNPEVRKGWINPSLPVFLLDRLPREPWRSLSAAYVANGWARPWEPYGEESKDLWSWWCS